MNKIKQVIIVEGKHDIDFLETFINADFIKTDGTSLPESTKELLLEMAKNGREFIILTDPDSPGESIRKSLQALLPNAKHAFVNADLSRFKNKVGVEHSSQKEILQALESLLDFSDQKETISKEELYELGLLGSSDSAHKREIIEKELRIGHGTSKTFLKRLNFIGMDAGKLQKIMKEHCLWDK